jgi:hypothetical protein
MGGCNHRFSPAPISPDADIWIIPVWLTSAVPCVPGRRRGLFCNSGVWLRSQDREWAARSVLNFGTALTLEITATTHCW